MERSESVKVLLFTVHAYKIIYTTSIYSSDSIDFISHNNIVRDKTSYNVRPQFEAFYYYQQQVHKSDSVLLEKEFWQNRSVLVDVRVGSTSIPEDLVQVVVFPTYTMTMA